MANDKKLLLNEAQITKFMKLANLSALTPGFVDGIKSPGGEIEERRRSRSGKSDTSHGRGKGEHQDGNLDEAGLGAMYRDDEDEGLEGLEGEETDLDLPVPGEEEVEELEPVLDVEPEADVAGGQTVSVDDFLSALETALEDVMGDEVEISQEPEDEPEEEVAPELPEEEVELGDVELEEDDEDVMESVDVTALVDRITSRVAQRLVGESLANKK